MKLHYTDEMSQLNNVCQYHDAEGYHCEGEANHSGFCYWNDKNIDKSHDNVKSALELYAQSGGLLRGIHLQYANLEKIGSLYHNLDTC